jgi:hypothetical protein
MRVRRVATRAAGLILFFVVAGFAFAQNASQNQTLTVNGTSSPVPVIQMNGRSYVDLDALARAANGSLSFSGNQIVLSLPVGSGGSNGNSAGPAAAPAQAAAPASNPGFSKAFLTAAIERMASLREWHSALATAIQNGFPISADWLAPYRAQAAMNLRLTSVAASTDSDRAALQLLNNEFQSMSKLADKYLAARANMSYSAPDALENDSLNQQIVACGHSLTAMAASGQFVDDGSCH